MKNMKKILALLVAVLMIAASMSAMAETKVSMDIATTDTHEYKVYQIFKGELVGGVLSNIKYGSNFVPVGKNTGDAVPTAILDGLKTPADADQYAKTVIAGAALETPTYTEGTVVGTLKADTTSITVSDPGWYLIVDDTSKELAAESGDAYSAYIVSILGDTTIIAKKDTVTPDKKITTDTLGATTTTIDGVVDNVSIGDTVNFQVSGNVPSHATDYNYYYFIMNDTLSKGLDLNEDSFVVYKNSVADENKLNESEYKVYTGTNASDKATYADGYSFQVALTDAKSHAGETIIVTYSAVLNENAKIGDASNPNTFKITYSTQPNFDYDGTKDDETPGKPDSTQTVPTTETVTKTTDTYTTGIEITKVDQDGKILTGAEFKITGDSTEIVLTSVETFAEATSEQMNDANVQKYYALVGGKYTKEAPVANDYLKKNGKVVVGSKGYVIDSTYTDDDRIENGGQVYRPVKVDDTDVGKDLYILVKANNDLYEQPAQAKYVKTVTYEQKNTKGDTPVEAKAEVGADGVVRFVGLGAGNYTITETKTPAGFNTIPAFNADISFTAEPAVGASHWSISSTTADYTYNSATGVFETTVVNNKGSQLPQTGGMGTTILYIGGSILVLAAAILLITKRRMNAND